MPKPKAEDVVKVDPYRILRRIIFDGLHGTFRYWNDHHDNESDHVPEHIHEDLEEKVHDSIMLEVSEELAFDDE